MSWAGLNINLSFSQRQIDRKTVESPFLPNERFPLQMLPSIKNQIKHWSSALQRVHSLQNTYPCTLLLICDLLCSQRGTWRIGGLPHGLPLHQSAVCVRVCVGVCLCVYHSFHAGCTLPSLTAVGQPSHVAAGDRCQAGKVAGLTSPVCRD